MLDGQETDLLASNPFKGGRPMEVGKTLWRTRDCVELSHIQEDSSIRYHLGFCECGKRITIGFNRMDTLLDIMSKKHFRRARKQRRIPLRHRIGKFLLKNESYTH